MNICHSQFTFFSLFLLLTVGCIYKFQYTRDLHNAAYGPPKKQRCASYCVTQCCIFVIKRNFNLANSKVFFETINFSTHPQFLLSAGASQRSALFKAALIVSGLPCHSYQILTLCWYRYYILE